MHDLVSLISSKEIVCCNLQLCKVLCKEKVMLYFAQFNLEIFTIYYIIITLIISLSAFPQTILTLKRDQITCTIITLNMLRNFISFIFSGSACNEFLKALNKFYKQKNT